MAFTAVLFPGQGSLTAETAAAARGGWPELAERAAELCGDDPFARYADSTRFAQPATFIASLAAWREREARSTDVGAMAGHSLGEISALAAAGAIDTFAGLKLVVLRGRLMAAADAGGAMAALLGATPAQARRLAGAHGLTIANDNAPGQLVLSGPGDAIDAVVEQGRADGLRVMRLDVAGAFHSPAVAPAVAPFAAALEQVRLSEPAVPVLSGFTARPFSDVRAELAAALTATVRWREVMASLLAMGADDFVDVGPGRVLERLVRRNIGERDAAVA
jgi:[acyl-carrier-protein] S-malonyltransferase